MGQLEESGLSHNLRLYAKACNIARQLDGMPVTEQNTVMDILTTILRRSSNDESVDWISPTRQSTER